MAAVAVCMAGAVAWCSIRWVGAHPRLRDEHPRAILLELDPGLVRVNGAAEQRRSARGIETGPLADMLRSDAGAVPDGSRGAAPVEATLAAARATDPAAIANVMAVLGSGRELWLDHKCESVAALVLEYGANRLERLELRAGHDTERYEVFIGSSYYRVDRAAFMAALRRAGLDTSVLPERD